MIKVLILSIIILSLGLLGLSIKLIFDKKAVFKGGSCSAASSELREKGIGECCGGLCNPEK
jgi:hypothetical protein